MVVGAMSSLIAFPAVDAVVPIPPEFSQDRGSTNFTLWIGILGLCCMAVVQSMAFSFLERAGVDRGFGVEKVTAILVALGFINLFPNVLAAVWEKRLNPKVPYAVAGSLFVAVMLFTHVFGFGLLARLDTTGRALAATPAIMMSGGAIGPVLGGTLVKYSSYQALGAAAIVMGIAALVCFAKLPKAAPPRNKITFL